MMDMKVVRLDYDDLDEFTNPDTESVKLQCIHGDKPCKHYDCRPCCPPRIKHFTKWPKRNYMYLLLTKLCIDDETIHPNALESSYFWTGYAHKRTRTYANRVIKDLPGIHFNVGGCSHCSYNRSGTCKEIRPALEAVGFRVVDMAKKLFGEEVEWFSKTNPMPTQFIAVAGLYTNENLSRGRFICE